MNSHQTLSKEEFEKIQQEREEYVKNIGIEYRFGCYEEKRPDSCHLLGEWMEAIQKDFDKAYILYKDNCLTRQYPRSCYKYANYRISGTKEQPKKLEELIEPYKIACDNDIPSGCSTLGLIYWNGEEGRKPNTELAVKYMERACELEDTTSCFRLSNWYRSSEEDRKNNVKKEENSELGFIPKNTEKALSFAIKACDLGDPNACMHAALMYRGRDGFPLDKEKTKIYSNKAKEIVELAKKMNLQTDFTGH
uniref:Sel1 repeat family protein n=1 Tax=Parastrongyloides trichosuri TaxID=131310 RepID=A0A0N5A226_PARTI